MRKMTNIILSGKALNAMPIAERSLYEDHGAGYKLSAGGKLLNKVRAAIEIHLTVERSPESIWGTEPAEIELQDWTRTISAATPNERRNLLSLKSSGRVSVKR